MSLGHIHIFANAKCANCLICLPEMRRIGAVFFCPHCCDNIFSSDNPVIKEREMYLKYLRKQNELFDKEFEG